MEIRLTSELESYINDKVKSGLYEDASAVIQEALRIAKTDTTVPLKEFINNRIEEYGEKDLVEVDIDEVILEAKKTYKKD